MLNWAGFNPRSRKGNDGIRGEEHLTRSDVSIHVPARGTTVHPQVGNLSPQMFQSTFPQGERQEPMGRIDPSRMFQSTFPQGERRVMQRERRCISVFQSTFPQGERLTITRRYQPHLQFQSTFPQGERHNMTLVDIAAFVFQSTFPQGERPDYYETVPTASAVSIHVPARGTTNTLSDG